MDLGEFSLSLTVKDLAVSKAFYEKLGFEQKGGKEEEGWVILHNGKYAIGLFAGMFEKNMLTFTPGFDINGPTNKPFTDVREIQKELEARGIEFLEKADVTTSGPAYFMIEDPDGNPILVDQHV